MLKPIRVSLLSIRPTRGPCLSLHRFRKTPRLPHPFKLDLSHSHNQRHRAITCPAGAVCWALGQAFQVKLRNQDGASEAVHLVQSAAQQGRIDETKETRVEIAPLRWEYR